ncbi:mannose-6-phosphate isomerase [Marinilabiliaceae bacterium JC017]|nr:mannose-6-phosphate isomerase [Marinilabiliaceae bacterium JC017]
MSTLYPLKFTPILKDKIWGGEKLKSHLCKEFAPLPNAGESWELSGVPGDVSVVANGFLKGNSLNEVLEIYMSDLVGEKVFQKFGEEFPLLIKFIDANDVLSIQVHPDDKLARERHDSAGKTEMWYVMQADDGASLISGFNKDVTKEEYLKHLKDNTLSEILSDHEVKPGDVFFIPAGRVHAIGKGILLAEIQQTSDVTYRIYDFDRKDDKGNTRELHTDLALDAIDYKCYEGYKTDYKNEQNKSEEIVKCDYFNTSVLAFDQPIEKDYYQLDSFIIYMCMEGEFEILYDDNKKEKVGKGETILIPAEIQSVKLNPLQTAKILEVHL